jgi:predicted nucleic acid-binding protein
MVVSLVTKPQYLLDTNVLVYAHDGRNAFKQRRAVELLTRLGVAANAVLPAQALAEFSSVALRKLSPPMPASLVYRQVEALEDAFAVLPLTPSVVLEAVRAVRDHKLSFYDAQIWAVAKLAQIPVILSEDFATNSLLEGISFTNPFAEEFDFSSL